MKYELKVSESGKYAVLKISGDITRLLAMKNVPEVEAFGTKHNIKNILVDLRESKNVDSIPSIWILHIQTFLIQKKAIGIKWQTW